MKKAKGIFNQVMRNFNLKLNIRHQQHQNKIIIIPNFFQLKNKHGAHKTQQDLFVLGLLKYFSNSNFFDKKELLQILQIMK